MVYELLFYPAADEALARLERDQSISEVLVAVNRTLDRLEHDPYEPRLGTRAFVTDEYGGVRATPARAGSWYVIWQPGEIGHTIEVILVHPREV